MAKRNSDIKASRKNIIAIAAVIVFALIASVSFNDAHAAQPRFEDQVAFHLTTEDQKLYGADFAWCLPTPTDGNQCYVLGSDMAGVLGAGDKDQSANAAVYGDARRGLVNVTALPEKARQEAYSSFKAVWGN
jgi:hypothetical protein